MWVCSFFVSVFFAVAVMCICAFNRDVLLFLYFSDCILLDVSADAFREKHPT